MTWVMDSLQFYIPEQFYYKDDGINRTYQLFPSWPPCNPNNFTLVNHINNFCFLIQDKQIMYTVIDFRHLKIMRIHLFHLKFTTDKIKNHQTTKATNKFSTNWNKWWVGQQMIAWKFPNCGADLSFPRIKHGALNAREAPADYEIIPSLEQTHWFVVKKKSKTKCN